MSLLSEELDNLQLKRCLTVGMVDKKVQKTMLFKNGIQQ